MTGQVLRFPGSQSPGDSCPTWCKHAADGHPYRYGLDDSSPATHHRLHTQRLGNLANGQVRLDLHQLETTSDPEKPGTLHDAEVVLSMPAHNDFVSLPSPAALAAFVASLQAAAAQLDTNGAWSK